MKKAIQILSFSLFISFTFPCFQMCSDASLMKRKHQETHQLEPTTPSKTEQIKPTHLWNEKENATQVGWDAARAEWTFTTYELALKSFQIDTLADLKERGTYPFLLYMRCIVYRITLLSSRSATSCKCFQDFLDQHCLTRNRFWTMGL